MWCAPMLCPFFAVVTSISCFICFLLGVQCCSFCVQKPQDTTMCCWLRKTKGTTNASAKNSRKMTAPPTFPPPICFFAQFYIYDTRFGRTHSIMPWAQYLVCFWLVFLFSYFQPFYSLLIIYLYVNMYFCGNFIIFLCIFSSPSICGCRFVLRNLWKDLA